MKKRICRTCHLEFDIDMFSEYRNKGRESIIHRLECKMCRSKKESDKYFSIPGIKEKSRHRARKSTLKIKYNMNFEDFNNLVSKQNSKCAICFKEVLGTKINIDHNHETGKVRGLLCWNCNTALGKFKDSTELLENALRYLKGVI